MHFLFVVFIFVGFGNCRAVFSVIRWLAIHECQTTNNATTSDATSNSTEDNFYKFTAALYGLFGYLQAIAAVVILIDFTNKKMWKEMVQKRKEMDCKVGKCIILWLPISPLFLSLSTLSAAVCGIGLKYDLHFDHCYTHLKQYKKAAVYIYHISVLITTLFINAVLSSLMFATARVKESWEDSKPVPGPEENQGNGDSEPASGSAENGDSRSVPAKMSCEEYLKLKTRASLSYSKICSKYRKKGKEVIPFTSAFRSWFVLHWFIYFLGIFIDLTYVVRPWIIGGDVHDSVKIYHQHPLEYVSLAIFIVYDSIVLIVPFVCGLKMNKYHDTYYSKLVKEREDKLNFLECADANQKENGALEYALMATVLKVQKIEEFDFTPSISGVDIPLTNPGYILSIVIAMVTLILGIFVNPLDPGQ